MMKSKTFSFLTFVGLILASCSQPPGAGNNRMSVGPKEGGGKGNGDGAGVPPVLGSILDPKNDVLVSLANIPKDELWPVPHSFEKSRLPSDNVLRAFRIDNQLFVWTDVGLSITSDNGLTWESTAYFNDLLNVSSMFSLNGQYIAVTPTGIYQSADKGRSWLLKENAKPNDGTFSSMFAIGTTVYGFSGLSFYSSSDGGTNFTKSLIIDDGANGKFTNAFVDGSSIYLFNSTHFNISHDNGKTWRIKKGLPKQFSLYVLNKTLFIGTPAGLFVSTDDGDSTKDTKLPSSTGVFTNISVYSKDSKVYVASNLGIFQSLDGTATWKTLSTDQARGLSFSDATIVASMKNGLMLSDNDGSDWTILHSAQEFYKPSVRCLSASEDTIVVSPAPSLSDSSWYGNKVYRGFFVGKKHGTEWTRLDPWLSLFPNEKEKYDYCISIVSGNYLWPNKLGLHFSTDGKNWINKIPSTQSIGEVSIDGQDLYSLVDNKIFHSIDKGMTWTLIYTGGPEDPILRVVSAGGKVLAMKSKELISSSPDGRNWQVKLLPKVDTVLYTIAASGSNIYVHSGPSLHISNDSGSNWTEKFNVVGANLFAFGDIVYSTGTSKDVTGYDYSVSTDKGSTFQDHKIPEMITSILLENDSIFIGTGKGLFVQNPKAPLK